MLLAGTWDRLAHTSKKPIKGTSIPCIETHLAGCSESWLRDTATDPKSFRRADDKARQVNRCYHSMFVLATLRAEWVIDGYRRSIVTMALSCVVSGIFNVEKMS